ncbi:hypothetical protein PHISP_03069 [Aspergillus sp. HF37]|nr:hypothetical protein PHISP_03069 [Aspergillus sp. HF37]
MAFYAHLSSTHIIPHDPMYAIWAMREAFKERRAPTNPRFEGERDQWILAAAQFVLWGGTELFKHVLVPGLDDERKSLQPGLLCFSEYRLSLRRWRFWTRRAFEMAVEDDRELETYTLPPTPHVPNSPLPVLVYRNALPAPVTETSTQRFIEGNGWSRQGPVFPAIPKRHFHPNVHECYGILRGSSQVHLGVGTSDNNNNPAAGLRLTLRAGDVVVHPAGTAHSNVSDEDEYAYLAFFPAGSPRWRSEDGSKPLDLRAVRAETLAVPIPKDPVDGVKGDLPGLWGEAMGRYTAEKRGAKL